MIGLPGNPHADYAATHDSPTYATLAVAFEVRTLTLSLQHAEAADFARRELLTDEGRAEVDKAAHEILARIGKTRKETTDE